VLIGCHRGSEKDSLLHFESAIQPDFVRSVFESRADDKAEMDQQLCHINRGMVRSVRGDQPRVHLLPLDRSAQRDKEFRIQRTMVRFLRKPFPKVFVGL
jgi:hypothetical protein